MVFNGDRLFCFLCFINGDCDMFLIPRMGQSFLHSFIFNEVVQEIQSKSLSFLILESTIYSFL